MIDSTTGSGFPGETYSVSELTDEIRDVVADSFDGIWVAGEVQRARPSQRGHLYFELVEKGGGDRIVGKIDAVLWRTDHLRVRRTLAGSGQEIIDGQQIRCWGQVDFYGPAGRLQLIVRDVDPTFTLGLLEKRRRETLAALSAAGLLERNRQHSLADVPLEIGLVTSRGSAAYHDFLAGLTESGYGFRVRFVHAAMQGREAEREVANALRTLAASRSHGARSTLDQPPLDAIVLIRGGGSRSDLAAFDSRRIAEAVARCQHPVLTGLGHEIDESIADRVSHSAFKTPTKVAEFLIERVATADRWISACEAALSHLAVARLKRAEVELRRNDRLAQLARLRLQAASHAVRDTARTLSRASRSQLRDAQRVVGHITQRLSTSPTRHIDRQRHRPRSLGRQLAGLAAARLRETEATLAGIGRLCFELSHVRVLERGYSITRSSDDKIITEPQEVEPGERIVTTMAGGILESRVEKR